MEGFTLREIELVIKDRVKYLHELAQAGGIESDMFKMTLVRLNELHRMHAAQCKQ